VGKHLCATPLQQLSDLENDRGMVNPGGNAKGYGRVGVRVQDVLPLAYPYPWGGYGGY
jgi:hypothetical protein